MNPTLVLFYTLFLPYPLYGIMGQDDAVSFNKYTDGRQDYRLVE
ncbi:hypothetical protein [Streptococcus sanguinis]|nr:hypothetical protein [Streptococcus sanguinis]MCC3168016.1 hypothetical protein [Streptococcus sanguinis]